jgi:hypothetical protein
MDGSYADMLWNDGEDEHSTNCEGRNSDIDLYMQTKSDMSCVITTRN